jgi:hypothetical protein
MLLKVITVTDHIFVVAGDKRYDEVGVLVKKGWHSGAHG